MYFWLCWVFIAACVFLYWQSRSQSPAVVLYLLIEVAFLHASHGLHDMWALVLVANKLSSCGSWALEQRLSSCGIWAVALWHVGFSWIRDRTNLCVLHGQADSSPLSHQGSPLHLYLNLLSIFN